ncbi:ABC transporter substrate-binding protein [Aliarcobacter skirrowii]|uniref:ABC transporter substrate-binding protein n=1 Tax=Aliarcobacter skirrowii TaxID=28200 RepID=UPI0029A6ED25|nr:ABC transporter substrate-binding protein [Aliarcobacter skirrowii]MDX4057612.1 ABC transporter substrate-binding protein [Aliarcobacter skirrowii]
MKNFSFLIFLITLLHTTLFSKDLTKVKLQLAWFNQFQYAGYYVAKEKGFYEEVGLDVEILPFSFDKNIVKSVNDGDVEFAIGRENLILDKSNYENIVVLMALFQASPIQIIAKKSSNIKSLEDFKNRKLMITSDDSIEVSFKAMLTSRKIDIKNIKLIPHSHNIQDLIDDKVDLMTAYSSKSPYWLNQHGIEHVSFAPRDYGFDMYSDFLYTNKSMVDFKPDIALKFRNASLKGWEEAFNNIEETARLIFTKYNTQDLRLEELIFEANELKKLAYLNNNILGDIKEEKVQRIYDLYNIMGFIQKEFKVEEFIAFKSSNKLNEWFILNFGDYYNLSSLFKFLFIVSIIFFVIFYRQYLLKNANKRLKSLVKLKTKRLHDVNKKLANKIKKELEINLEKDRILAQQQKMISMGQMIENIAHQWRQPLSIISTRASTLKLKNDLNMLENKELNEALEQIVSTSNYLSQTIDDFRYFFKPQKEKAVFSLSLAIQKSIELTKLSLEQNDIKVIFKEREINIYGYETELIQVFINAINNSKDAFFEKNIKDKLILINLKIIKDRVHIEFLDNALGVPEMIINKIFEPYFTTKHQYNGTGIGLYMSSEIITKHMKGSIFMVNCDFTYEQQLYKGAKLTIVLDIAKR